MKQKKAKKIVEEKLPKKRYEHSIRVAETAVKLAEIFGGDTDIVEMAGILHDYAKYDELSVLYQSVTHYGLDNQLLSYNSEILHGPVAAAYMKDKYEIDDEVYDAIYYHTTGRAGMGLNEKLIFISDYIEPNRSQPGVERIRDIIYTEKNLDKAIYEISKNTALYLIENDKHIYPKTIECLNYYNLEK
ncbi:bis(5'-nucleosyl)-tetraphosphatase (symmetrical) YqeK [Macrococcoides caseolyticum]|uniref:bis(5'-nucleosyl)-tetraphosphatase (symmetrical) YqeK n=1 Tax=Macrococcoides caseolyticum TaxID=69966 RepID=UPI001F42FEA3|nr:bis(5'-nucleosyl)-tetraphosphatase (symmetrical) YqeK [Macrococcus caseolyticus]MCE4956172.1 bis(5'-nucleosyl)-tetraphosphatase (symmetrical) YqeK [Macrococcus caseolyticus]